MADYPMKQFFGTPQTVFSLTADIAAGNFSAAGTAFTNNDAVVPAALKALAMIEIPDWSAAPVAGTSIELWAVLNDTNGTSDDTDPPSGAASNGARLLGTWQVAPVDTGVQRRTMVISLSGIQTGFTPYLKNGTAVTMVNSGGTPCVVKITPFSEGVTR